MKHLPLIVAVVLFSVACASGVYWGAQLSRQQAWPAAGAPHAASTLPDLMAAAGLFGGTPSVAAATAFKLKGVIEDGPYGVAILVEDGKPALAVGIGQQAAPGVTVTEVHQRYVLLDVSGKPTRLDFPDGASVGPARGAAAPAASTAAAAVAAAATPATSVAPATPVASATPTAPPGLTNDQRRQMYEERRRQEMEQVERARRTSGMAPPPSGSGPAT